METQKLLQKLDYEAFAPRFGEWAPKFKPFIESKEMWDIMQKVKTDAQKETVVPKSSDTFRAFATTRPSDLKVVFYLMDPYPRRYSNGAFQATGIAMDCSNSPDRRLQPSLINWYDAIQTETDHNHLGDEGCLPDKVQRSPNLTYLHEQGVMLLNTDLTCKLNKTQSHEGLWEPLQRYFLEQVIHSDTGIIYILCGKASLRMEKFINPFCRIFKLSHPAAAAHTHTEWDSKGVFTNINKILRENNGFHVYWDKTAWDVYKDPPF